MISVIVPVYNVESYLDRCIQSIVQQTYRDLEIILLDDGSTDGSLAVCERWSQNDNRIQVIHHENCGVSETRNIGLERMSGEFLCFVDADDYIAPTCLEIMANKMREGVDIVCCDFEVVREHNCAHDDFRHIDYFGKKDSAECMGDYYQNFLYMRVIWGKLYRSSLWKMERFENIRYSEDTRAMLRVIQNVNRVYFISTALYFYFQRMDGASHRKNNRYYREVLDTSKYACELAERNYFEYKCVAAKEYINLSYVLLKRHLREQDIVDFNLLLDDMKQMNKNIPWKEAERSQRFLCLPSVFIRYLLRWKMRKGESYE